MHRLWTALTVAFLLASISACGGSDGTVDERRHPLTSANGPPDRDGLYLFFAVAFGAAPGRIYMAQMEEAAVGGATLRDIVNVFTTKAAFLERYPADMSDHAFAARLVSNVVQGSASESAQRQAVADVLAALAQQGATRGNVIFAIVRNLADKPADDPDWAGTAQLMRNQVAYARHYTEAMQGDSMDPAVLRRVISWVNQATAVKGDLDAAVLEALNPQRLLHPAPMMLPDLAPKFLALCGNTVGWNIQTGLAVSLQGHQGGRKDLIFSLWCEGVQAPGVSNLSPVKNTVVALLQNQDGSFRDGTKELFGTDFPDIGGIPHYAAAGDYNGDGRDDVVYSVSREDGRDWSVDHSLNGVQPAFVTSGANGKYRVERHGAPEWGYGAMNIDNESGGLDVLTGGEIYDVWRYTAAGWTAVANYSSWATPRTYFFARAQAGQGSTIAIVGENSGKQLSLRIRTGSHEWQLADFYSVATPNPTKATFIAWNGQVGEQTITRIEGKDYTTVYFDAVCELRMRPGSRSVALTALTGSEIVGGFKGQVLKEGEGMISVSRLMAFSVEGGKLSRIALPVEGEVSTRVSMYGSGLRCRDVNGDGADDIELVTAGDEWGTQGKPPILYLNDGQGNFKRIDPNLIPSIGPLVTSATYLYEDMDGDGIRDLVYFSAALRPRQTLAFPVYKGQRAARKGD